MKFDFEKHTYVVDFTETHTEEERERIINALNRIILDSGYDLSSTGAFTVRSSSFIRVLSFGLSTREGRRVGLYGFQSMVQAKNLTEDAPVILSPVEFYHSIGLMSLDTEEDTEETLTSEEILTSVKNIKIELDI